MKIVFTRKNQNRSKKTGKTVLERITKNIGPQGLETLIERGEKGKNYEGLVLVDPHVQIGGAGLRWSPFAGLGRRG